MTELLANLQSFWQPVWDLVIYAVGLLDALPGFIRAMLTAILLVLLLARLEREIKAQETRFAELFQKSAFFALAIIPTIVLLFPSTRMVVYTEVLPSINSPAQFLWLALAGIWGLGALIAAGRLLQAHLLVHREQKSMPSVTVESKLHGRLQHWQRRLGTKGDIHLSFGNTSRPWHSQFGGRKIGLPNAAEHWPAAIQDLLVLQELCQYQKKNIRWHLLAQLMVCAYWPLPWVRRLQIRLDDSLQLSADELSEACYRDPMGYARGLRQIEQRLAAPKPRAFKPAVAADATWIDRAKTKLTQSKLALQAYGADLSEHWRPQALPRWDINQLLVGRGQREIAERHSDPYDRALVAVGQAVFLAVVLTGTTLREIPEEVDRDLDFAQHYRLIENFHRSLEKFDAERAGTTTEDTANVSQPVALPKSSS